MFPHVPLAADIDPVKRETAANDGIMTYDPTDPSARKAVIAATGGVYGACDFVGSESSLAFAASVLAKGGKVVVTGLLGGSFATAVAMFPLKAMTIEGTMTGTLAEAREVLALARAGKIPPIRVRERPLTEAQAAFEDVRAGNVVGRVVLTA
jgi:alcohol dehydrogenase, propanol-preferring